MQALNIRFVRVSSNRKTGPIPVTSSSADSCSITCPLNKGDNGETLTTNGKLPKCYAGFGNTAIHWRKLNSATPNGKNILDWEGLCNNVRALPKGQLWRHNEAGDLPTLGDRETIDPDALQSLVRANRGKRGFTYTHHSPTAQNASAAVWASRQGFTVNLSANNVAQALEYKRDTLAPIVTILPIDAPNVQTVEGIKIVACPAEKSDKVQCANCALCYDHDRDYIIGFRAHGTAKKKTDIIARG